MLKNKFCEISSLLVLEAAKSNLQKTAVLDNCTMQDSQGKTSPNWRYSVPCEIYLIPLGRSCRLQKGILCTEHWGTNSRIIPEHETAKVHVYYFRCNFDFSLHRRQVSAGASKNWNILVRLVELLYTLNSPDNITSDEHLSSALHKQHQGAVLQHWTQPPHSSWSAY